VELGFYAADRREDDLLQAVLGCLSARGARATGRGYAIESWVPFAGPTDFDRSAVVIDRLAGVADAVPSRQRLVEVEVAAAFRYDPGSFARVTYLSIDREDVSLDNHPVAIWASGEVFSHPPGEPPPRQAAVAAEVVEVFTAVVEAASPGYAAITVDWPLESPHGFARDPTSGAAYHDFFVGCSYVGEAALSRIEAAAAGLTLRRTAAGLFVLSYFAGSGDEDRERAGTAGEALAREIAAVAAGSMPA